MNYFDILFARAKGGGSSSVLIPKTINENGTFSASDDDADGYSEVTVNVPRYNEVLDQGLQAVVQEEE